MNKIVKPQKRFFLQTGEFIIKLQSNLKIWNNQKKFFFSLYSIFDNKSYIAGKYRPAALDPQERRLYWKLPGVP